MIVRVWRCKCKSGKIDEFENFIRTELFPLLRNSKGCIDAVAAKASTEMIMVTVWKELDSLERFTGPDLNKEIVNPRAATYLDGTPQVELFELVDKK